MYLTQMKKSQVAWMNPWNQYKIIVYEAQVLVSRRQWGQTYSLKRINTYNFVSVPRNKAMGHSRYPPRFCAISNIFSQ